jgi:hypothetical protein
MATKPTKKPPAKPPAAKAKPPVETPPAAGELAFDSPTTPVIVETTAGQRPDSRAAQEFADRETIHASQCVVNSECTLTPGCRGRLRQTNAISGKVQIYCPKCGQFAAGTRPLHGLVSGGGGKLFDRVGGK